LDGERITPGEWTAALRSMRFGTRRGVRASTIRAVALTLASYADYRVGTNVRPGTALLAVASEVDYSTAKTVMKILRDDLGLIEMVRGGRRQGAADEYQLAMPEDITDRVEVRAPSDVDAEVERIRATIRRQPTPVRRPPTPVQESPVQGSPTPVPTAQYIGPHPNRPHIVKIIYCHSRTAAWIDRTRILPDNWTQPAKEPAA
jgi:hypothetical protein